MSLRDIASSVRRNHLPKKPVTVNREPVNIVAGSVSTVQIQEIAVQKKVLPIIEAPADFERKSPAYSRGTSITAIAKNMGSSANRVNMPGAEVSWEKCRCLKRGGEKLFCTKFFALCAKEKCPKKYIEN